jgi:hypothetical protein
VKIIFDISVNFKETLIKIINDFFESIGIKPILGTTLIFCLLLLSSFNKIKVWNTLSKGKKQFIIIGGVGLVISLTFYLMDIF